VKLIRFELKAEPEKIRSGIVQAGKVYETEGGQGVGVYEAAQVRPLIPVSKTRSVRLFHQQFQPDAIQQMEMEDFRFFHINPGSLIGPSQLVPYPYWASQVSIHAYLAGIVLSDASRVELEIADDLILALTILSVVVAEDKLHLERSSGIGIGASHDIAAALGPVLTTPDELEGSVEAEEMGRKYALEAVVRVNGVERARGNTRDLPLTLAQAIACSSNGAPLREGDIVAIGPIALGVSLDIQPEDEVQVAIEDLGAIALKLSA
jgi:2-keto-4-pentenoate hydratase/2-oxohepta-3-ene-1,7-dioic acid hydratase in catechol pathway